MLRMRFLPLVVKQIVRQPVRAGLAVAGVAVAMFLFGGVSALQSSADAAMEAADPNWLIVYRKDRYCPSTSRLPESYADRIARIPGAARVVPVRIAVNNCRAGLDVVTFRGVRERDFVDEFAPRLTLAPGAVDAWRSRSDAVLVGETLARRRRLNVGDRFNAAGVTAYVAGVVRSDEPEHDNVAYAHLPFLQFATGGRSGGYVTQFNVRLARPGTGETVAAAIDAELAADAEPTQTRSPQAFLLAAADDVMQIVRFTRWFGWGCLAAVLGLVGNALALSVRERVRHHAVLMALGYDGRLLARLVVAEGLMLSAAGGLVGLATAQGVLRYASLAVSVEGNSIAVLPTVAGMIGGFGLTVAIGVAAGLWPAVQAARREIADALRVV